MYVLYSRTSVIIHQRPMLTEEVSFKTERKMNILQSISIHRIFIKICNDIDTVWNKTK